MTADKNPITRESLLEWGACWFEEKGGSARVDALVPHSGLTPLDVVSLTESGELSVQDMWWVILREACLSARTQRLISCDIASRAMSRTRCDSQQFWRCIDVARMFANSLISKEDMARTYRASYRDYTSKYIGDAPFSAEANAIFAASATTRSRSDLACRYAANAARDVSLFLVKGSLSYRDAAHSEELEQLADVRRRIQEDLNCSNRR